MSTQLNSPPALDGFIRRSPSPALAAYVQNFWWLRRNAPQPPKPQYLYADGGSGVIFNFAAPLSVNGDTRHQTTLVNGPDLHSTQLQLSGCAQLLGVRFHPGMGFAFLDVALDELHFVDRVPGLALDHLTEQLNDAPDIETQQHLLEQALLARLHRSAFAPGPAHALLDRIKAASGTATLSPLLNGLGLSQRQLERQFKVLVGVTPKQYSRILRVGQARWQLKQHGDALVDIAYAAGYFDQAHFIHDFKTVVGLTPGQYRQQALGLAAKNQ